MPKVVIRFEIADAYDADKLHEDLCLTVHEGDLEARKKLEMFVIDIEHLE